MKRQGWKQKTRRDKEMSERGKKKKAERKEERKEERRERRKEGVKNKERKESLQAIKQEEMIEEDSQHALMLSRDAEWS